MVDISLRRILYMEDDPGLSRLLQKSLQRRGYIVDIAADGEEGLSMLASSSYDLLLVDYNMPFCGGIDVIRTLSAQGALLPTIMVTGQGNEEIAVEALKLGASDYVVKDVEMKYLDLLPVIIDRVLYQQHILRESHQMEERSARARNATAGSSSCRPTGSPFSATATSFSSIPGAPGFSARQTPGNSSGKPCSTSFIPTTAQSPSSE